MEQDLKIATLKNEMMYRPTNKFNINDSIRQCSFSQSPEASKSTRRSRKERFPPNGLKLQLQLTDSSVDTSSETNTVLSSRSLYSHAMEQNSLFQLRDNDSIEQYIAQITEREKIADQESDNNQSNFSSQNKPQVPTTIVLSTEEAMHFSIRCNNLSKWNIDSSSVKVKTVNFKIIHTILFRESAILRLKEVMQLLDKCYWKYCVNRIREYSLYETINSENLVSRRNQIFALQNEVSVGIAHIRSLTMTITELVQKLRNYIATDLQMSVTISIFWKDANYILKMIQDCDFLFDYPSCRYWVGFVPNCLMIPPKDHNPEELWKNQSSELLCEFLNARTDDKQHKSSTHKQSKGRKASILEQTKRNISIEQLNPSYQPVLPFSLNSQPQDGDSHGQASAADNETTSTRHPEMEDWEQLKDYCSYSWSMAEVRNWPVPCNSFDDPDLDEVSTKSWIQSAKLNPMFWNNPNHNPLVVEAALGFPEVFPSIFLVPPLPNQLLISSLRLHEVLHSELRRKKELEGLEQWSHYNQEDLQNRQASSKTMDNSLEFIDMCRKLKIRQQGTSSSLQGLSIDHLSSCLDSKLGNLVDKPMQGSTFDNMSNSNDSSSDWPFLTSQEEKYNAVADHHFLCDDHTRCASIESLKSSKFVDLNAFRYFRLENCSNEYRKKIEQKISDCRKVVERDSSSGLPQLKQSRKGLREVSRLHQKWIYMHAVSIQKICRGFLGRTYVKYLKAQARWKKAVVEIQAICRGFLARRNYFRLQQNHKIHTFLLRKGAIKRFRAAVLITRFIRNSLNRHREAQDRGAFNYSIHSLSTLTSFKGVMAAEDNIENSDESKGTLLADCAVTEGIEEQQQARANSDDGIFSISDINFDDAEKLKFERMKALALIKRVNEGKVIRDSRRSSRLIPSKDLSTAFAKVQVKQFSKKTLSLFAPADGLRSAVSSTNDVFVHPLSRSIHTRASNNGDEFNSNGADDSSSITTKGSSFTINSGMNDEVRSLPPLVGSEGSRSTSISKISFADHLSMKEMKRRQKEAKETEQIRSVLTKYYSM